MRDTEETDPGRRHFLKCMAWAGTGALWTMSSGILKGSPLGQSHGSMMSNGTSALRFVQIPPKVLSVLERTLKKVQSGS